MTTTIALESRLDTEAASPLKDELLKHLDEDVRIDASKVDHLGAMCLQVLLSAVKTWKARNKSLTFTALSDHATAQLASFGIDALDLQEKSP